MMEQILWWMYLLAGGIVAAILIIGLATGVVGISLVCYDEVLTMREELRRRKRTKDKL